MSFSVGGWTEGTSIPVGQGADSINMCRVTFCSANLTMIIVLAHFNPRPGVCSIKDITHPEVGHILTILGVYVLGCTDGAGPCFIRVC